VNDDKTVNEGKTRRALNPGRHPALLLSGSPEVLYWPRVPLELDGEVLVPDVLLRVRTGARVDWVHVEVDEGGVVSRDSRRRQERLGLPLLRLDERDILSPDFVDRLVRRVQGLLGLQVVGYRGPAGRGVLEAPRPPRVGRVSSPSARPFAG